MISQSTKLQIVAIALAAGLGTTVAQAQPTTAERQQQLQAERARLQERMAAIDEELASLLPLQQLSGPTKYELAPRRDSQTIFQAPYDHALPVRISGRSWSLGLSERLEVVGGKKDSILREDNYWRVTDGTRSGYVNNVGVDIFRDGVKLSYEEQNEAFQDLAPAWDAHFANLSRGRKLLILGVFPDGPDSAGGVGVAIIWRNLDVSMTIKYIAFSVVPYNAVGDRVADALSGAVARALRGTGPFDPRPPEREKYDEYSQWDPQWYNASISCIHLDRIDVEYMDGTTKTFSSDLALALSPEFQNDCTGR